MRRRDRRLLLAVLVLAGLLAAAPAASAVCTLAGDGSGEHPFLVGTKSQLEQVGEECGLSAAYLQTADITWVGDFEPIAAPMLHWFDGGYDGGGHAIIGLHVAATAPRAAMFANVTDVTIQNLELRDVVIDGDGGGTREFTGALIAYASADNGPVTVRNVHVTGESHVRGSDSTGGLIGYVEDAYYDPGTPPITDNPVAVTQSSSAAEVVGNGKVGGLVGWYEVANASSTINRSWASGAVQADTDEAGGLIGLLRTAGAGPHAVDNAYARGAVRGATFAGGVVGRWENDADPVNAIHRTYATGAVSSAGARGGIAGYVPVGSTVLDSLYDTTTTGQDDHSDSAKTTAQMQDIATYRDAGWGIAAQWATPSDATAWGICADANGGYPFLLSAYAAPGPCVRAAIAMKAVRTFAGRGGLVHAPAPRKAPKTGIALRWREPADAPDGTTYTVSWRVGSGSTHTLATGTRRTATLPVGNTGNVTVSVASSHGNVSNELQLPANALGHPSYAPCRGPWQALCSALGTGLRAGSIAQVATFLRSGTRAANVVCRGKGRAQALNTRLVCRLSNVGKALLRRGPIVVRMTTTLVRGSATFVDSSLVAIPRIAGT